MNINFSKKITLRNLETQAYLWLEFPVVLLLFGWFHWWIALPLVAGLCWCVLRDLGYITHSGYVIPDDGWKDVRISRTLVWSIAVMLIVMIILGIGGLLPQMSDHFYRNAVFYDLAKRDWPVTYDGDSPRMLCYYFTYWLPESLVSKATGYLLPGDLAQILWTLWGLTIALVFVTSRLGGKSLWWIMPALFAFGFLDRSVYWLAEDSLPGIMGITDIYTFYSNYTTFSLADQIFMIYNQGLPCWVALPMIWRRRYQPGQLILPCALLFCFSPLPCVGIALPVAYRLCRRLRQTFSLSNLVSILTVAVVGMFFISNNNAAAPANTAISTPAEVLRIGFFFYLLVLGPVIPVVWNRLGHSVSFWIMFVTGFFMPLFVLGNSDDLARRSMIPMTIMLTYAVLAELRHFKWQPVWKKLLIVWLGLVSLGCSSKIVSDVYHLWYHIYRNHFSTKAVNMMGNLDNPDVNDCYDNFIADGDSFYRRWLMRGKPEDKSERDD